MILAPSYKEVVPPEDDIYWDEIRRTAAHIGADGCTLVSDIYLDSCLEHDIHYRWHTWIDGSPITKEEADRRFRAVIQSRSPLGRWSPVSWVRWAGVALFGQRSWDH